MPCDSGISKAGRVSIIDGQPSSSGTREWVFGVAMHHPVRQADDVYTDCQLHVGSFSPAVIIWVSDSLGLDSLGGVATWRALLGLPDYQRTLTGQSPRALFLVSGFCPTGIALCIQPWATTLTSTGSFCAPSGPSRFRVVDRGSCQKRAYGG